MSVVANVAINIDASKGLQQLKGLDTAIENLTKNAAAIPNKVGGGIDGLGSKLQTLGGKFASLSGAVASLGAGTLLKGFLDAGVQADRTGKTIKALASEYGEVAGVQKIASAAAKEFGMGQTTSARAVADLYGRLRPMGISLDQIGTTFNGVNKAASLMNLSAADTSGVLFQLSQAMGSGRLQGDELRSVMERLPAVGQAIAKTMGVSVSQIKQLGADGLLTTEVIVKAMEQLNTLKPPPTDAVKKYEAAMEDLQTTIGSKLLPAFTPFLEALTKLINGFTQLPQPVQSFIIAIGGIALVAATILAPLGFIVQGIGALVTALGAANIGGLIAGWLPVLSGFLTWVGSTFIPALIAFFSGPVGWTVLAVAAVVAMVALFHEPIGEFLTWLGSEFMKAMEALGTLAYSIFVQPWVDLWNNVLRGPVTTMFGWIKGYIEFSMKTAYALAWQVFVQPWINLWNYVLREPVTAMIGWIQQTWSKISKFFNDNIVAPIKTKWTELIQFLRGPLTAMVSWIQQTWSKISQFFNDKVVTPIKAKWTELTQFLPKALQNIGKFVSNTFSGIVNTIKNAFRGVLRFIANLINTVASKINVLIDAFNRLPGPDIPRIPMISVPAFAKGGVVSSATLAIVGEAGPEYIIPESKMAQASMNYLAGARGGSVIPAYAQGGYVGGGTPQINIQTGPVMQQDGQRFVSFADLEKATRKTAEDVYKSLRTPAGRYAAGVG